MNPLHLNNGELTMRYIIVAADKAPKDGLKYRMIEMRLVISRSRAR